MICFNDKTGKQWTIDLNLGTAKRVKAECGVDLINIINFDKNGVDTTILQQLSDDAYLLVSVLFSLCKKQVAEFGLDEDSFAEVFDAEAIENAVDALIKEIINFSQPVKKKMLTLIYEKTRNFKARAEQHLDSLISSKEFQDGMEEQLNKLLTNTQESSE